MPGQQPWTNPPGQHARTICQVSMPGQSARSACPAQAARSACSAQPARSAWQYMTNTGLLYEYAVVQCFRLYPDTNTQWRIWHPAYHLELHTHDLAHRFFQRRYVVVAAYRAHQLHWVSGGIAECTARLLLVDHTLVSRWRMIFT